MAQLNCGAQHPIQRNEHRDLHQYRQAAPERIDLFFFVQRHHLGVELGTVIGITSLNFFEFRGNQFHLAHTAASCCVERIEHRFNEDRE